MADPATQFQAPGIQATGYTPTHYSPIGINVPTGAGQLWAGVGDTAMKAAGLLGQTEQMMQQSPYNPAVHAQMLAQQRSAQEGIAHYNYLDAHPEYGQWTVGTDAQGNAVSRPVMEGTATFQTHMTPEEPEAPRATLVKLPATKQPAVTTKPITKPATGGESYGSSAAVVPGSAAGSTAGSTGDQKPVQPVEKSDAAESNVEPVEPKVPGGASTNTATTGLMASTGSGPEGNYAVTPQLQDPLIERQSAADYRAQFAREHPQGGSIWSPMRPSPMAPPPAPGADAQPQPATSQTPAAATQADQAAMQKWQNQNAHPVMSSQDALAWAKNQSTLNQDATYLPMGGPGGSPAFAFHVKGGGMNIVPVSQMVAKGAGPLVAAQNTSQVISSTDQQSGATPMPSGTGAGAPQGSAATQMPPPPMTPMPSGTGMAAPQGQPAPSMPPPAPTAPMPSGTGLAAPQGAPAPAGPQPQAQYPNISGPPPAPVPGAYDPTPYRQAVAQAIANPSNLMAQTGTAGQAAAELPTPVNNRVMAPTRQYTDDEQKQIDNLPEDDTGKVDPLTGYPYAGTVGGFPQYRDTDYRGRKYTPLPGPTAWTELRWYTGTPGYVEYYTPDGAKRAALEAATLTDPALANKNLTHNKIAAMKMDEVNARLEHPIWLAATKPASDATIEELKAEEDAIRQIEQMKAIHAAVGKNVWQYGSEAAKSAEDYRNEQALANNPEHSLRGDWQRLLGHIQRAWPGGDPHPMADDMKTAATELSKDLSNAGVQTVAGGEVPAKGGFNLQAPIPKLGWLQFHKEGTPARLDPLDIPAIKNLLTGNASPDDKNAGLQELEDKIIQMYKNKIHTSLTNSERIDEHHINNKVELSQDKTLYPLGSAYLDGSHQRKNPYPTPVEKSAAEQKAELKQSGALPSGTPTASPTPRETITTPEQMKAFKAKYKPGKGATYNAPGPDGNMMLYHY